MAFFCWSRGHNPARSGENLLRIMAQQSLVFLLILVHITALQRMKRIHEMASGKLIQIGSLNLKYR
jgi:flagellar biogenesis protein FliO